MAQNQTIRSLWCLSSAQLDETQMRTAFITGFTWAFSQGNAVHILICHKDYPDAVSIQKIRMQATHSEISQKSNFDEWLYIPCNDTVFKMILGEKSPRGDDDPAPFDALMVLKGEVRIFTAQDYGDTLIFEGSPEQIESLRQKLTAAGLPCGLLEEWRNGKRI